MRDQFVFAAAQLPEDDTEDDPILRKLKNTQWPLRVNKRQSKRSVFLPHGEHNTLYNIRANEMRTGTATHLFKDLGDAEMNTVHYCMLYKLTDKAEVYLVWVVELPQTENKMKLEITLDPITHYDTAELKFFDGRKKSILPLPKIANSFDDIVSIIRPDM